MSVVVFSKPDCVQCKFTRNMLDRLGVAYDEVDLTQDAEAMDYVKSLGHLAAPVVVAGGTSWSGFRPDRLTWLAQSLQASA